MAKKCRTGRRRRYAGKGKRRNRDFRGGDLALWKTEDGASIIVRIEAVSLHRPNNGLYHIQELNCLGKEHGKYLVDPQSLSRF